MNYYKEDELKKVLIHELGHFVAHQILFENFEYSEPVNIDIWYNNDKYAGLVNARHRKNHPKKFVYNGQSNMQEFEDIVSTLYGCIFQSIYSHIDVCNCYNSIDGSHDFDQIELAFKEFGEDIEQYKEIFFSHIHILTQSEIPDIISQINLNDFFEPRQDNHYQILSRDVLNNSNIKKIIKTITSEYLNFYEKIKKRNSF
ncbi:hypothetical protein [uncultured Chryseobacterium sp.]|uniref:hypothetical protein n=1 Tax=uncultured Chryseobacterium sp. TaxID=259322 RepID=UPI0026001D10|nr:hypothetical protein [uncultured Chryseobacterium sp.]